MSSDTHHHQADRSDRRNAGRDGPPSRGSQGHAGADWEADARAQIVALLGGGVDEEHDDAHEDEEGSDLDAVRRASMEVDEEGDQSTSAEPQEVPERGAAWYDKARRRMASLFGDDDEKRKFAKEHREEPPAAETSGTSAPREQEEAPVDSPKREGQGGFKLNWVVDDAKKDGGVEADEEVGAAAEAETPVAAPREEPHASDPEAAAAPESAPEQSGTQDVASGNAEAEHVDPLVRDDASTLAEHAEGEEVHAATAATGEADIAEPAPDGAAATEQVHADVLREEVAPEEHAHAVEPEEQGEPVGEHGQRETTESAMKARLSRHELEELAGLLNDEVVLDALEAGVVPLTQVVKGVRRFHQDPSVPLWRHLLEMPGVDRDDLFERAARLAGYEAVDITEDRPSSTFLHTVLGIYPPKTRQRLIELRLLPFAFEPDVEVARQGFLIATHDPSREAVQAFIPDLDPIVELYYASEDIVAQRVEEMRELEATFEGDEDAGEAGSETDADAFGDSEGDALAEVAVDEEYDAPSDGEVLEAAVADAGGTALDVEPSEPEALAADEAESVGDDAPAVSELEASVVETAPHNELVGEAAVAEAAPPVKQAEGQEPSEVEVAPDAAADARAELKADDADAVPGERPTAGDFWKESGSDLSPHLDDDGGLTPEQRAQVVLDDALLDQMDVVEATEPGAPQNLISGDGYGDLNLTQAQQGEELTDDFGDLPDEPPLPPDVSWADASSAPLPTQQVALATKDRVVAMLLHKEIVTPDQVERARAHKEAQGLKDTLWRVLVGLNGVAREEIFREAASMYAFPVLPDGVDGPDPDFARNVMNTFGERERDQLLDLRVLPYELDVEEQSGTVRLAFITHDPTRPEVHRLMKKLHLERFELMYATEEVVGRALAEAFPRKNEYLERMNEGEDALDLGTVYQEDESLVDDEALEAEINRSTLINLFEASLIEAVRRGASDLHIYPNANKKVEIHFRVDGRLAHWHTEEKVHPEAMLAVIKDNSTNVDRFERDAAQDGFIQRWIDDALIRFRVSVLPIANASQELRSESIVIRVLDDRKVITDLSQLGLLEGALERFDQAIHQPHGMVILTGPTGSGKSTTLVASLHQVVTPEVNVLTVEDPVEYIIPGVRQIKLNHKLDLSGALRAILRHDPDVVMVGEMRDRKTAELAIKLANTGHLTFSTLHTNDAPSAISRLYKMGIEPFLIAYAINLVVAQRLIRTLCPECKVEDSDPDPIMLKQLGFSEQEIANGTFYLPAKDDKCPKCRGQGYKGRRAVSEALYFSRPIRHMIVEADGMIDESAIRDLAEEEGMLSLSASAREVVKMGETSAREMMRVIATGD